MSLINQASLVITPNAYKESKLYSVVPNTTLGDMDVVRATTATRVNSAGLIEVVPRNLLTYSEQIDTANWVRQGVSATANQAISPNGTLTAELLDDGTAASTQHWIFQNLSLLNGTTYTISFYAKYISRKFMAVNIFNGLASQYVYYNIQDGLVSGSTGDVTASITSVGNGWFRIVYTRPMATSGSAPNFRIALADDTSNITYTGSNKQAYVWGFQLENFATATEYFPTTTRLNIPRIDYTNGSCPSILVEPQRTNLFTYSEQFDNVAWTKVLSTITENDTTSPSGIVNADKYIPNTTNGFHPVYQTKTITNGVSYSFSIYVKSAGYNFLLINTVAGSSSGNVGPLFDLSNGTLIGSLGGNNYNAKITSVGNSWYKINFSYITSGVITEIDINCLPTSSIVSFAGNGTSGLYLWGAQLELGSNATSYIPTVASTVTRNADVISKTGISSLIGQTEGTIFAEVNINNWETSTRVLGISNGTVDNRIIILQASSNRLRALITNAAVLQTDINTSTLTNGVYKIAIAYKANDVVFYVNGVLIGSDTSVSIPACSAVYLGKNENSDSTNFLNNRINSALIWKTRLTDAECIALTTL